MQVYSHSRLEAYENCPLRFKLQYLDKVRREGEGIEAFLGNRVHETLKKCHDDVRFTRLNTLDDLLTFYDALWQKNWHPGVTISRPGLAPEHYQSLGRRVISSYYARHAPFTGDVTLATELALTFPLDEAGRYRINGFVDRLSRTPDGAYWIHDYKTSSNLPSQADKDTDRQLALYQIGVQSRWPGVQKVKLVWHYLAHDCEIISERTPQQLDSVASETIHLIDKIESATDFPPNETGLCGWCEYSDLCPQRKHLVMVDELPPNQFLSQPGVVLVNRFAELRAKADRIDAEMGQVREAIVSYALRNGLGVVRGSAHQVRIRFDSRLKFPAKGDAERSDLDRTLTDAGYWYQVSRLDTAALARLIEGTELAPDLIEKVMQFARREETSSLYLSRLKEEG